MPNKVYNADETSKVWTDDTTGGDYTLDLGGMLTNVVRAGDIGDLGASPRATLYRWTLVIDGFDAGTPPVVGDHVDLYLAFSHDGTQATTDGDLSGTDGNSDTATLMNLMPLGSAVVQTNTAANELVCSGVVEIFHRYVIPVVHNNTVDTLLGSADAHKFILTPVPPEIQ